MIAETIEAARKAKAALRVAWSAAPAQGYGSAQILEEYSAIAADWNRPGVEMLDKGDAAAAIKAAAKVITADFFSEHVSHVCMEPLNATVRSTVSPKPTPDIKRPPPRTGTAPGESKPGGGTRWDWRFAGGRSPRKILRDRRHRGTRCQARSIV
jgi:hypothetical protein